MKQFFCQLTGNYKSKNKLQIEVSAMMKNYDSMLVHHAGNLLDQMEKEIAELNRKYPNVQPMTIEYFDYHSVDYHAIRVSSVTNSLLLTFWLREIKSVQEGGVGNV